jgi:transposase
MIREAGTPEPTRDEMIALISAQSAQIAALIAENSALKARIGELERRLGLNSSNSGKPPSSDGLKKPARVRSLREKSQRKPGGQKGHKGETLRQSADPNVMEHHFPSACAECGAALTRDMSAGHAARQVFDLPEPKRTHPSGAAGSLGFDRFIDQAAAEASVWSFFQFHGSRSSTCLAG